MKEVVLYHICGKWGKRESGNQIPNMVWQGYWLGNCLTSFPQLNSNGSFEAMQSLLFFFSMYGQKLCASMVHWYMLNLGRLSVSLDSRWISGCPLRVLYAQLAQLLMGKELGAHRVSSAWLQATLCGLASLEGQQKIYFWQTITWNNSCSLRSSIKSAWDTHFGK